MCEVPSHDLKVSVDFVDIAAGLNASIVDHQLGIDDIERLPFYLFILSDELSVLCRGAEDELFVDDHLLLVAVEEEIVGAEVRMTASELFQVVCLEEGGLLLGL